MVACVIPAFRAATSIVDVVAGVLPFVDHVIVVDDRCPQSSGDVAARAFAGDPRVEIVRHERNRGVGGATKTGMIRAMELGARFIVKLDSDGQMDPAFVPDMVRLLLAKPDVAMVKGNRFFESSVTRIMPPARLLGNSVLTLLARITTGFWSCIDPTNGFLTVRAAALKRIPLATLSDRYFFEISLLAALGMRKIPIGELEMPAIYGSNPSSLTLWKAALAFPGRLFLTFVKRVIWQYIVSDMNVASIMLVLGSLLTTFALVYGGTAWFQAIQSGVPRTAGTVMVAFLPFITGFQLLLNALIYDVQFSPTVHKVAFGERAAAVGVRIRTRAAS